MENHKSSKSFAGNCNHIVSGSKINSEDYNPVRNAISRKCIKCGKLVEIPVEEIEDGF